MFRLFLVIVIESIARWQRTRYFQRNVAGALVKLKVKIGRRGLIRGQYGIERGVTLPDAIFFRNRIGAARK